jgi:hypothetical protein
MSVWMRWRTPTRRVHTHVAVVIERVREPPGTVMGDQDQWCSGGIPLFDGSAGITARGAAAVVAGAGVIFLAAAASYFFLFPEPGSTARVVAVSCVILGLFCVVAGLLDVYSGRGERFFSD